MPRRLRTRSSTESASCAAAPSSRSTRQGWRRCDAALLGSADVVVDVQNGLPFFSRLVTRAPVVVLVHHVHREQWPVVYPGLDRQGRVVDRAASGATALPPLAVRRCLARDPVRAARPRRPRAAGRRGAQRDRSRHLGADAQVGDPDGRRGGPAGPPQAGRARHRRGGRPASPRSPTSGCTSSAVAGGRAAARVRRAARRARLRRLRGPRRRGAQARDLRAVLGAGPALAEGGLGTRDRRGRDALDTGRGLPQRRWHPGVDQGRHLRGARRGPGRVHPGTRRAATDPGPSGHPGAGARRR